MLNIFKQYFLIWSVFFLIALGLGYPSLARYSPASTPFLDDSAVYSKIVENGLSGVNTDHRSTRVLVPLLARQVYHFVKGKIGAWNSVQFSLLIIAAIFCALTATLIVRICEYLYDDKLIGLVASFIFYANFSVPNLYLSGLVDAAECFFILLLLYLLLLKRWNYIPIVALLAAFAKETFLPIGGGILAAWWLYDTVRENRIDIRKSLIFSESIFIAVVVIVLLKSYALGDATMPWQYAASLESTYEFTFDRILVELRRFSYAFLWLLPLALFRIRKLPMPLLWSVFFAMLIIFSLGVWHGVSGAAMSRYIFSLAGPMLSISAALFLVELLREKNDVIK